MQTTTFRSKLTAMFEQIEPQLRADQIQSYKNVATGQLERWLKLLDGVEPVGRYAREAMRRPDYVITTETSYSYTWARLQEERRRGIFVADYVRAEHDATAAVDHAKAHFIEKQAKKLESATKNHSGTPKIGGSLRFAGLITGAVIVKYDNGDEFTLTMSIITNHRYERGYKSFYQFPARFGAVKFNGRRAAISGRISQAWMEANFRCPK